jgi:ankyrin repeat protein
MKCLFHVDKPLGKIDTYRRGTSPFTWFAALRKRGAPPLYYAALFGFLELAKHLVVKYPRHVNARGGPYMTPLVAALAGGHFQTADLIFDNDAELDVRNDYRRTPLMDASRTGHLEVTQWLISRGADPNVQEEFGRTALHFASLRGDVDVVRILLQHNRADPNVQYKCEFGEFDPRESVDKDKSLKRES